MSKKRFPNPGSGWLWFGLAAGVAAIWYANKLSKEAPKTTSKKVVMSGTGFVTPQNEEPRFATWRVVQQRGVYLWEFEIGPNEEPFEVGEISATGGRSHPITFPSADEAYQDFASLTNFVPTPGLET